MKEKEEEALLRRQSPLPHGCFSSKDTSYPSLRTTGAPHQGGRSSLLYARKVKLPSVSLSLAFYLCLINSRFLSLSLSFGGIAEFLDRAVYASCASRWFAVTRRRHARARDFHLIENLTLLYVAPLARMVKDFAPRGIRRESARSGIGPRLLAARLFTRRITNRNAITPLC